MPMYDYRCKNCDEVFEELVYSSMVPDEEIKCPNCGQNNSERLLSAPMISTGGSNSGYSSNTSRGCGSSGFS
ncbi:zinc ribbon domain-containing protein [bacterium]|nr:zinc ribbon domain-containing protein [bacterium]